MSPKRFDSAEQTSSSIGRFRKAESSSLGLDPSHDHQQSLELGIVAIALPEINELADYLEIAGLVVTGTVNAIERWQQIFVHLRAEKLKRYALSAHRLS